jgi:hypothetical protein
MPKEVESARTAYESGDLTIQTRSMDADHIHFTIL